MIMYLECWHGYYFHHQVFHFGLIYTTFFSLFLALCFTLLSTLFSNRTNKIITGIITLLLCLIFAGSYLYINLLTVPFTIHVTTMASQAFDFIDIFFISVREHLHPLWLFFVPFLYFLLKETKKKIPTSYHFEKKCLLISILVSYVLAILVLLPFKEEQKSAFKLYFENNDLVSSIQEFGLLTAEILDIERAIIGFEEDIVLIPRLPNELKEMKYNKMDIDFEKLSNETTDEHLKNLYAYFNNEPATNKNQYTGKYKGKNLIVILAESYNSVVLSEELTPTLYQLTNTGFHFNNFYSPLFLSTTGGEFQLMTGLVPSAETLNAWYKGTVYLPFSLGNALGKQNYTANAFHNFNNTYYDRDKTMPTLGFQNFLSCASGLEELMDCTWQGLIIPDDKEMVDVTLKQYVDKEPFVSFYVTVSGHMPYYYNENRRNYDVVKDLPYTDKVKAYIASQIDLDRALKSLINGLKEKGILDDTVICLVGDHYPYGLSIKEINELSTYNRDELFEVNHSDLILWNNDTEKIEIDKVGSQPDVLPTLLNLFGVEYDSRLLIGHDILSDNEGLAIFSDLSWISDSGTYNAKAKTFTPKKEVSEDYVKNMNQWVNNSVIVSKNMIENDVYDKILNREEE